MKDTYSWRWFDLWLSLTSDPRYTTEWRVKIKIIFIDRSNRIRLYCLLPWLFVFLLHDPSLASLFADDLVDNGQSLQVCCSVLHPLHVTHILLFLIFLSFSFTFNAVYKNSGSGNKRQKYKAFKLCIDNHCAEILLEVILSLSLSLSYTHTHTQTSRLYLWCSRHSEGCSQGARSCCDPA